MKSHRKKSVSSHKRIAGKPSGIDVPCTIWRVGMLSRLDM